MITYDTALDKILQNLSEENRDILLTKISIMFKLNEIIHYQNCKKSMLDPHGKELMELLIDNLESSIAQLESTQAVLPDELTEDFSEISDLILREDQSGTAFSTGDGNVVKIELGEPPTEHISDELYESGVIDEIVARDRMYLETCLQKKIFSIRLHSKLFNCSDDIKCKRIFEEIVGQEKDVENLLVQNYQLLENTGKWRDL
jgi:hypothetical protein